jgi:Ca2+-binding EF-hand superfamily protein
VNYEELDTGLAKTFGLSVNSEEMKILHTQFDKNNDGIISWAEFDTVLVKAEGLLPH